MKKNIITLFALTFSLFTLAQEGKTILPGVGIGTKTPSKSAQLEISSTDKGILIPRLNLEGEKVFLKSGGGDKDYNVGMLVYHKNSNNTELIEGFYSWTGEKWERITSQSELTEVIKETKTEMIKEIEKITEVVGSDDKTDKSFMVVYNPNTKKLSYLEKQDNGEYKQAEISFGELVQEQETNTYFKEKKEILKGETKETLTGYIYYSEEVIKNWQKDNPGGDIANIPDDDGFMIDVVGTVNKNIETIIKEGDQYIQNVINEADGTVRVQEVEGKLVLQYKPTGKDEYVNVDLSGVETVTSIDKFAWNEKDGKFEPVPNTVEPTGEKGKIYYKYAGEKNEAGDSVTHYIDLSTDIVQAIQNDTIIQQSINNTVEQHFETIGGNVFYGKVNDNDSKEYLYVSHGDQKEKIDISESVREVFETIIKEGEPGSGTGENTNEIINTIKEAIGLKVLTGEAAVDTGNTIDGKKIFKQSKEINVSNTEFGYDSDFTESSIKVENFDTLLNVTIYNSQGTVVCNSVTDVDKTSTTLKFSFGQGKSYSPLVNGKYIVVFEYLASK